MENNKLFLFVIFTAPKYEKALTEELAAHKAYAQSLYQARGSAGGLFTVADEERIVMISLVEKETKEKLIEILNTKYEFGSHGTGIAFALNFDNEMLLEQIQKVVK